MGIFNKKKNDLLNGLKILINGVNILEDDNKSNANQKKDAIDNKVLMEKWDFNNDFIHEKEEPLLKKTKEELYEYASMAYLVNTAKGVYYMKNNDSSVFTGHSLWLDNGESNHKVLSDIIVTGTLLNATFMIVYDRISGIEYLIDTRGILYILEIFKPELLLQICGYKIKRNFKKSCLEIIGHYKYEIPYMDKVDAGKVLEKTAPDESLIINKKFIKFLNQRKCETDNYLYFTLSNGKNGAICRYFCEKYGNYEILPNVFIDDETINVRIKMPSEKDANSDYYFMCSRYNVSFKNYSIYNVSIENYVGALDLYEYKLWDKGIYTSYPKPSIGKAPMYISINETLKQLLNYNNDFDLFKKLYHKLEKKIEYCFSLINYNNNTFESIRIDYPNSYDDNFIEKKKEYYEKNDKYKEVLKSYEANILELLINNNYYIPKWKSESDLYVLIKKQYQDAIFQYRASWLGQQSIDVFVPSLKLGFEYQGEQHFKPVNFFGGQESFESTKKRDIRKQELCEKNGIRLIYWNYNELVNIANLKEKLKNIEMGLKKSE